MNEISAAINSLHGKTVTVVVRDCCGDAGLSAEQVKQIAARVQAELRKPAERDKAAAWTPEIIERSRKPHPERTGRIVIGVDPGNRDGDERGIIVAELADDGDFYVLADCSGTGCITSVMSQVVEIYHEGGADAVVGVANLAGSHLRDFLHREDPALRYRAVHWMRGYADRVEPLIDLYNQGRVHHAREFPELERQMCAKGGARVNALVVAIIHLRSAGTA